MNLRSTHARIGFVLALVTTLSAPVLAHASPPTEASERYAPSALLNEGNAQFRAGHVGRAILDYERGRLLAPRDHDLEANLDRARAERALPPPPESVVEHLAGYLSVREWVAAGSTSLAATLIALALVAAWPRRRRALGSLALAGALAASVACVALWLGTCVADRAVVVANRAVGRISPFDEADTSFSLNEGDEVDVRARHAGYLRIEDAQGRSGWIPSADVQPILPN